MLLNELADNQGSRHRKMRVGRGIGSGKGKTCGRGGKGQTARSGVAIKGFEGGQMPIHRRLPKRGFNNINRIDYAVVNIGDVVKKVTDGLISAEKVITRETLISCGLIRSSDRYVKLLSRGDSSVALNFEIDKASSAALEAVKKAGGSVLQTAVKAE